MKKYKVADFEYKIEICDHILDNIYGHIGLTNVEKEIEKQPIFKRLHHLSQLGLANWIFPCALHTRYVHSIGVMHIAGEMASRININMGENFFCDSEIQILRLTGMLHDIGHYPLSHNIEYAYKDAHNSEQYLEDPISLHLKHFVNCPDFLNPDYTPDLDCDEEKSKDKKLDAEADFSKGINGSTNLHHENMGNLIITNNKDINKIIRNNFVLLQKGSEQVLNSFFVPIDNNGCKKEYVTNKEVDQIVKDLLIAIGNIVIGNYNYERYIRFPWMEKYSAMIQLIHSDLDADNLDYLLRDATFSGTSYGTMDMGILLNCLCVKRLVNKTSVDATIPNPGRYIVGITKKGIGPAEQFLFGKFMAYTQMINSKFVSILEAMIFKVFSEDIIDNDKTYNSTKLIKKVTNKKTNLKYLRFSDCFLYDNLFSKKFGYKDNTLKHAILSRLINSCAFDLEKSAQENECIYVGTDEKNIIDAFNQSQLYNVFKTDYYNIKDKLGKDLSNDEEKTLFSYRFEKYSLTKQIPIDEFNEKFLFSEMTSARRFELYYYRLGKGIPILDFTNEEYSYCENESKIPDCSNMPQLIVDSPMSILKNLRGLQFVSLRKYKICDAGSDS